MATRLSEPEIELISEKVAEKLEGKLRSIMNELLPCAINTYNDERNNIEEFKREARNFINAHQRTIKTNMKNRKEKFEQFSRSLHLVDLYDECMSKNPPYIPKKFREDRHHVRNERELEKINNKSMASFQCEYDILTIRKSDYKEQLETYQSEIQRFLDQEDIQHSVQNEIKNILNRDIKKDEENITKEWKKKIIGVKKSFVVDKKNLENINRNRFRREGPTTREQNIASTLHTSPQTTGTTTTISNSIPSISSSTNTSQTTTTATTATPTTVSTTIQSNLQTTDQPIQATYSVQPTETTHPTVAEIDRDEILADDTILDESINQQDNDGEMTNIMIQQLANDFNSPFRNGDTRHVPPNDQPQQNQPTRHQKSLPPETMRRQSRARQQSPSPQRPRRTTTTYYRRRSRSPSQRRRPSRYDRSPPTSPPRSRTRRQEEINRRRRIEEEQLQYHVNPRRNNQRY